MKEKLIKLEIEIPQGITISYDGREISVKGKKGENKKLLYDRHYYNIQPELEDNMSYQCHSNVLEESLISF